MGMYSLVLRPSLTALSLPWKKAWVRPGSKHHVTSAIAFITTRAHGFMSTRDVFMWRFPGTL